MSNFKRMIGDEQYEAYLTLIDGVRENLTLPHWVEIGWYENLTMKDMYRVKKLPEILEDATSGLNIIVEINLDIFDKLTDEMQIMVIDEILAGITVNPEGDKISLEKFDISTYSGILEKYGDIEVIAMKETIKSLFDEKLQFEKDEKERQKAAKAASKAGSKTS